MVSDIVFDCGLQPYVHEITLENMN